MKSAAYQWVRLGMFPAAVAAATALAAQFAPAPVEASSLSSAPVDAADLLPPLPAPVDIPAAKASDGTLFELTLRTHGQSDFSRHLVDAGASRTDAVRAAELVQARLGGPLEAGTDIKLGLGPRSASGGRAITALVVITDSGMERIDRREGVLALASPATARSISVPVEGGAYWSLRAAGLAPMLAAETAALAERRLDAGPGATITAVVGERPARFGTATSQRLLLVSVGRSGRAAQRLMSWPGAEERWIDPDRIVPATSALERPVAGRVTSAFGTRFHPILNYFRAHRGVDFAARSGDPVRAAADGCVAAAGWSGGYGRQVRLVHRDALRSSYSHLANAAVEAGECVRRGQLIGYAGASGLATGPHLHFEVYRDGRAINPLHLLGASDAVDAAQRQAIAARLARIERAAG